MPINSRRKGKAGELELAGFLRDHGHTARRGQQFSGGADSPDVICESLPVHWEVKRTEKASFYDYLDQARRDCAAGKIPVVAHRKNKGDWIAILPLKDLLTIFAGTNSESA